MEITVEYQAKMVILYLPSSVTTASVYLGQISITECTDAWSDQMEITVEYQANTDTPPCLVQTLPTSFLSHKHYQRYQTTFAFTTVTIEKLLVYINPEFHDVFIFDYSTTEFVGDFALPPRVFPRISGRQNNEQTTAPYTYIICTSYGAHSSSILPDYY